MVVSTDTAFLLGVLALVGPGCPVQLRLFLLTLAVADDVGALSIIALAYTDSLDVVALGLAAVGLALMMGLRYLEVWRGPGTSCSPSGSGWRCTSQACTPRWPA